MADSALRALERAAAASPHDREAAARLIEARIRAGGRNPRLAPREGDQLAGPSGGPGRQVRLTWPRLLLTRYLPAAPYYPPGQFPRSDEVIEADLAYAGRATLVGCEVASVDAPGPGRPWSRAWRFVARAPGGPWREFVCYSEPETEYGPLLPVAQVEWVWVGRPGHYKTQTSTLLGWRRWAKRATVVRVGDECGWIDRKHALPRCCSCGNETVDGGVKEGHLLWCLACAPSPADE